MGLCELLDEKIKNGRVTVLGIGVSNRPLIKYLLDRGARVTARDKKSFEMLMPHSKELEEKGVELILGDAYLEDITEDVIFRAPGIRPDLPQIKKACNKGALLTSEMELFFELTPATVLAVTGSDGKTTTTTLTYKMLEAELAKNGKGRVWVGGNIGTPLLQYVDDMTENDFAVVELSSFQLHTMRRSPKRAIITNITPNHLDWHTGMDEYTEAKCNICKHKPIEHLTVNAENELSAMIGSKAEIGVTFFSSVETDFLSVTKGKDNACAIFEKDGYITFSDGKTKEKIIKTDEIKLPGRHNVENYMAAISITRGLVSNETVAEVARTFGGVAHRLEFVRELDGVKYYNSSIDSSPSRTAAALSALAQKPIIICGGYDKNIPFEPLATALCDRAKKVVLTGATAPKIMAALLACPSFEAEKLPVIEKKDFEEAVKAARSEAENGDIVLLSPACASFDAFVNFEERGNRFKCIVNDF
ncbi:MAG: UDP-N-acetylmuramoyl-L-alanine--D-glutamate ligase [Clostridia bacterium]|nr:UDP-N-acetylmuramoyl-L-alanine--D-glutamate ligase [Clostridia bacterium]